MIHRIRIVLDQVEYDELVRLSLKELRAPSDQALVIPESKPEIKHTAALSQPEASHDA